MIRELLAKLQVSIPHPRKYAFEGLRDHRKFISFPGAFRIS